MLGIGALPSSDQGERRSVSTVRRFDARHLKFECSSYALCGFFFTSKFCFPKDS